MKLIFQKIIKLNEDEALHFLYYYNFWPHTYHFIVLQMKYFTLFQKLLFKYTIQTFTYTIKYNEITVVK